MKTKSVVIGIFSLFVLVGGIVGYLKAGSIMSIAMSGLFSTSLFICGYQVWKGNKLAYDITLGLLLFLFAFFGYRFSLSYKMMPGGMMMLLSGLVLAYLSCTRNCKKVVCNPLSK